jgi:hypothetical protein
MWQRIQTVFLGVAIIALGISLVQPVWLADANGSKTVLTPFYLLQNDQYLYMPYSIMAMFVVAGITIAILEIRRFDNRMLQIKLGLLNTAILLGAMICVVVFTMRLTEKFPEGHQNGIGMYLIFAGVLFNWLALRFIRRDEQLVKDSDRIR